GTGSQPPPQVVYVSAASPAGQQIMQSLGMANITTSLPITGKFGQMAMAGFSSIGGDPFSYPQRRNNFTAQISYSGTITRPDQIYSFGAEWLGRRVETRVISNALPFLRFSGLQNTFSANPPIVNTPSGVPSEDNLSAATLAAMGVPSAVSQTFLDLRPQSLAAPQGLIPVQTLTDSQGGFFVQHERQVKPRLRITAGLRIDVANVSDPASDRNRTRSALYNHQQLLADAQEAENNCGVRCSGLSSAIAQTFKANSFSVTAGSRFRLGPRLGFSWAPVLERAWSVRGGVGMQSGDLQFFAANDARQGFNTFVPMNLANFPITSNQGSYLFNLANSAVRSLSPGFNVFPQGLGSLNGLIVNPFLFMTQGLYDLSGLGLQPTIPSIALIEPSPGLKNPYSLQYSVGTEIESHGFGLSLSYVGTRGVKLLRLSTPIGGSNRGSVGLQGISVSAQAIPTVQGQLFSPVAQALLGGSLTLAPAEYESTATSLYNSVQFEIRRHYHHGIQFSSAITYSRASDDSSDVTDLVGSFPLPQDSRNRSEWGRSNFDVPFRLVSSFVWDIAPKQRNPLFRAWQVSGITIIESGQPFTVNSTFDVNEDGNLTDRLNTASRILRTDGHDPTTVLQLAPGLSTWAILAPTGQDGSVQRNSFRAPVQTGLDLALTKVIEVGEGRQITARCEGFNALNSPQFGIPQRLLEAPSFGHEVRTIAPARLLQFGIKFSF
ncbi:MAG TPA: hypothetical protein VI386_03380, partial [Candidatus Sulfotelmatobacter sp.]